MFASGVRRSWLAQATSSRRESNSRRRFSPISLKRRGELRDLGRPILRRPSLEVATGEVDRRVPHPVERVGDRRATTKRGDERRERGRRGHGENLHVVAHVEHDPAGQQHRAERQQHGEHGEAGELQPHRGQPAQAIGEDEPDGERRESDDVLGRDHGVNL